MYSHVPVWRPSPPDAAWIAAAFNCLANHGFGTAARPAITDSKAVKRRGAERNGHGATANAELHYSRIVRGGRPMSSQLGEKQPSHITVATASLIGTAIEWYDFFLYGTAA